ncbi:hypothetical protein DYQ86_21150 [Acidobacteria bacterium AB60]|nr:hypothetical protein DYQ86_21150 [Acidobacteria bacterium AB60]
MATINAALAACPKGEAVVLSAGTYTISGTVHIPANVTLRGVGADKTILNATGTGEAPVQLGSGSVVFVPRTITSGATAGSTQLVLGSTSGVNAGSYLVVTETNDPNYVTAAGSGGNCNWCDGSWTKTGNYARGQIVQVTAVSGNSVTISPGLYTPYTNSPIAVAFNMAASYAGVESLQVKANNTGYTANFAMDQCAYCWIKAVESNYADGDHVEVSWGYHDEIRDSYFSNAYLHTPGTYDSDVKLVLKTSASLIENNIIERTHVAIMLEWGPAGNVIAYNYTMGEFDSGSPNVVIGGLDYHGAHPQFNLVEGNVMTQFYADSIWGSSSDTTAFRNWFVGTNHICAPASGRGTVSCTGTKGYYGYQAARAIQFSYLSTRNYFVGNLVGSSQMQALLKAGKPVPQADQLEYAAQRPYEAAQQWTFGYGSANDDGLGNGCGGGVAPCHKEGNTATQLLHGNYDNLTAVATWASGMNNILPTSFYLSGKPGWWGTLPFPAIGPDIKGGSGPGAHSFGNPAQNCYLKVMGGSDGGQGGPLTFNAGNCYATDKIVSVPATRPVLSRRGVEPVSLTLPRK